MRKGHLFLFSALIALAVSSQAVTINLTSDKTEMEINETITFHLEVHDAGFMGGSFTLRIKEENNTWKNVRTSFSSSCTMCKGSRDMGDLKEDPSFIPLKAGLYRADATYGGESRFIDFTVRSITTTTSTTTPTTSTTRRTTSTTTSTSTPSTTSTTAAPTTTSSTTSSSTTRPGTHDQSSSLMLYMFGMALVALTGIVVYAKKR